MSEQEVAAYLKVNPRTLYRYRKSGKLPFRQVAGKTRPVIDYERGDIEALKKVLEEQRVRASQPPAAVASKTQRVAFGLPPGDYRELEEEATKYGLRVGEYARRLVREGLESQFQREASELREQIKRLAREVEGMRAQSNRPAHSASEPEGLKEVLEQALAGVRAEMKNTEKRVGRIANEVGQTQQLFKTKFDEFAAGLEAILEFTGLSPEEAKQWVSDNLR